MDLQLVVLRIADKVGDRQYATLMVLQRLDKIIRIAETARAASYVCRMEIARVINEEVLSDRMTDALWQYAQLMIEQKRWRRTNG